MSNSTTIGAGGQVLWHVAMSLDGYTTGPHDAMDWISGYRGPTELIAEIINNTGAVLAGRRWFDVVSRQSWDRVAPYGGASKGPCSSSRAALRHRLRFP